MKKIGHVGVYLAYTHLIRNRTFVFNGSRYPYVCHRYNNTCETERSIEIPIAWAFLDSCVSRHILEIGNVLNHYRQFPHTVVDKYEVADGVLNIDVQHFVPQQKYDAIVSLSTMEHVGWDEQPFDQGKALRCIERLRDMLNPGGRMLLSFPIGHNSALDQAVAAGTLGCKELRGMKRQSFNSWTEAAVSRLLKYPLRPAYRPNYQKYRRTHAVVLAYFGVLG